jgi:hypothetical protein
MSRILCFLKYVKRKCRNNTDYILIKYILKYLKKEKIAGRIKQGQTEILVGGTIM